MCRANVGWGTAMYFNISQLLKEFPGARRLVEIDDYLLLAGQEHESRVRGTAGLLRSPDGVWVTAELRTTVMCDCSRCLESTEKPVRFEMEEEFLPTVDISTGAAVRHTEEEAESFHIDSTHTLDIREAVRQYVAMNLPLKPVCSKACAGICPSCGVNRNDKVCDCDREVTDSRWGPLLGLATAGEDPGSAARIT